MTFIIFGHICDDKPPVKQNMDVLSHVFWHISDDQLPVKLAVSWDFFICIFGFEYSISAFLQGTDALFF